MLCQILLNLAIAAIADAILMQISAEQISAFIFAQGCSQVLEIGHFLWPLDVHANICTDVVNAAGHDLALYRADFHSICPCSVYVYVNEVLKCTIAVTHQINVPGEL